jgi:fucose 4-O-acetylase-like acetyltransferase
MKSSPELHQTWLSKAFNLSVLRKSRLQWVDYLKGIAIMLVVYRHVLIGIERTGLYIPPALTKANMIFYSFRMPLFFILSGIFISSSLAKRTIRQFVYIKFENLLYPYLIWSFLQVTIQIVLANYTNSSRGLIDYAYILYQPRNLDQFWYLPALFNTTVIYLLVKTKLKPAVWVQFLIGLFLYFLSPYVQKISMLSDWMEFYLFFALGDAISSAFFKEPAQRFLKNPLTLAAMIPLFVLVQLFYLSQEESYYLNTSLGRLEFLVIALVGCLAMFALSFRLQSLRILSFLRVLGFHSLYIYIMHVIVAGCVRLVFTKIFGLHNPSILLLSGIAFGVTLPIVFYNLLIKDNILWWLFTLRKSTEPTKPARNEPITTTTPINS